MKCHNCGKDNVDTAKFCRYCGTRLESNTLVDTPKVEPTPAPLPVKEPVAEIKTAPKVNPRVIEEPERRSSGIKIFIGFALALVLVAGGLFGYYNIYLPIKIDKDAPRYFPYAERTFLRSSQVAGINDNKLATLQYGSELIVYEQSGGWTYVKNSNGQKGYVASDYLMEKKDFYILNSIWGDRDSRDVVSTAKCRLALLEFYKANRLIGIISPEVWNDEFPDDNLYDYDSGWQIFCLPKKSKYNYVYYARLTNPRSKFTDFCAILRNVNTGDRKIVLFSFDDDETPHIVASCDATDGGLIKRVYGDPYGGFKVEYVEE